MKLSTRIQLIAALAILIAFAAFSGSTTSRAQNATPAATQSATTAATASAATAAATSPATPAVEYSVKAGNLPAEATLTLAAFSVPREAYAEIIPAFTKYWLDKTGQKVTFKESYQASGAQSRAVAGGFKADVVAFSLESDVTRLVTAKLITGDWKKTQYNGIVTTSVAVLVVRKGNPKGIKDWADLAKPGVEVITPNPATSGGAQWNLLAAYGAAKRGKIAGVDKGDDAALAFLKTVIKNFSVLDKDGRESFLTFQKGVGDVAITYENEAYAGIAGGDNTFEIVYPASTIFIENPAAVVDVYAKENGTLPTAQAFVDYLITPDAQKIFAAKGFRPLNADLLKDPANVKKFPAITDQFTIAEFGGWSKVAKELFGDNGTISKAIIEIKGQ